MSQRFPPADLATPLDARLADVERQLRHLEERHNALLLQFSYFDLKKAE